MEDKILKSLSLRPGMQGKEELLKDLIDDAIQDVKDYINYTDELPDSLKSTVQEIVLIRFNKLGNEGISSTSMEGISQSYIEGLPSDLLRKLRRYRKLP